MSVGGGDLAGMGWLLDTLEHALTDGCDAHVAAERVLAELCQLGQEVLGP